MQIILNLLVHYCLFIVINPHYQDLELGACINCQLPMRESHADSRHKIQIMAFISVPIYGILPPFRGKIS